MSSLMLKIITPAKELMNEEIVSFSGENEEGKFGILKDHIAFITSLKDGIVSYETSQKEIKHIYVYNGILKVKTNQLVLLCESCNIEENLNK